MRVLNDDNFSLNRVIGVEAVVSSVSLPKIPASIPRQVVLSQHLLLVEVLLGLRDSRRISNVGADSSPIPKVPRWTF